MVERRKRILFVVEAMGGGVFTYIVDLANELVKEFDITSAQIKAENITLGDTTYAGGVAIKPSVTITVPGGKATLKEGTDYTVSYEKM